MDLWRHLAPPSKSHVRLHPKLWMVFAAFCIACVGIDVVAGKQLRAIIDRREAERISAENRISRLLAPAYARQSVVSRIRTAASNLACRTQSPLAANLLQAVASSATQCDTRPTRAEVEACLLGGRSLRIQRLSATASQAIACELGCATCLSPRRPYGMATYCVPEGDLTIRLVFSDNRLQAALPPLQEPAFYEWPLLLACEVTGETYRTHANTLWVGLLMLTLVLRRDRVILAEFLLMVGILTTIAEMPSLNRTPFLSVAMHDQDLPWGLCMVFAALALLSFAYFRTSFACAIFCPVCDYNLRANTNGICSECGAEIPPAIRERLTLLNPS
ncbi:MAG TPA: hypothetical protein PKY77_09145 [Phycisphaerae bacterium]|nr:hypothetical protein [Phycisphaerae bacterium]HRY68374.1 hypothetical protein [Phycisphaerae bacterium]HSA27791.1 hypothetical protein [Phycisphaerae bacterium]